MVGRHLSLVTLPFEGKYQLPHSTLLSAALQTLEVQDCLRGSYTSLISSAFVVIPFPHFSKDKSLVLTSSDLT